MTPERFAIGLKRLSVLPGPEMMQERMDIYFDSVRDLSDEQWVRAVDEALRSCEFFPVPARLRRFASTGSEGLLRSEAQGFLARVLDGLGSTYSPQTGTTWSLRDIVAATNPAFGDAIGAGGGASALANCDPDVGVPIRDRKIIEAYAGLAEKSPQLRLPQALPELTQGEAKTALEKIRRPKLLAAPANDVPPKAPKQKPSMTQAQWDARREALRRQRDEMGAEGG